MQELRDKYISAITDAADEDALEAVRLAAVGKKGEVSLKMRELGKMTPEERQVAGPALNARRFAQDIAGLIFIKKLFKLDINSL